jgi:hypothetical protein
MQGSPYLIYITDPVALNTGGGSGPTTVGNTTSSGGCSAHSSCLPQALTMGTTFISGALNQDPAVREQSVLDLTGARGMMRQAPQTAMFISRLVGGPLSLLLR